MNNNVKIIFIGAGPVGLWTAIQIKLRDPSISIEMLEKYLEYKRDHTLHVSRTSLISTVNNKDFQKLIHELVGDVKVNEMELKLLNFAKKIGIKIRYEEVKDLDHLESQYPSVNYIIGSDGSHSLVRKIKFGDDFDVNFNMKYIVDVKYEVEGDGESLSWFDWTSTMSKCDYYIKESIYKLKYENRSRVTLRIFIDQDTYKKITENGNCTFKNPSILVISEIEPHNFFIQYRHGLMQNKNFLMKSNILSQK